ncbi:MAG: ABC transporter permease [Balneolales bacterium]|nr:ABC transporter permease [Balneolales bacterium]
MDHRPPEIAEKLLTKLLYDDVWKTTLGDFEEHYHHLVETEGKNIANRWYWSQLFRYAPSKIVHKFYWSVSMFKNYLKIAFRNLKNQKSYSFINIMGLTIGLACFILIGLFIRYELSYDSFHTHSERTFRVVEQQPENEYLGSNWFAITATAMAATMKQDYPEVEYAAYFTNSGAILRANNEAFDAYGAGADGDFFNIFTYTWYRGNEATALDDPNSIILTQSMAETLFGNENPIGQTLQQVYPNGRETEKTVTGVVADPPKNSHFDFQYIANDQTTPYYEYNLNEWGNTNVYTFITLRDGASAADFSEKLPDFANTYTASSQYYQDNPDGLPNYVLQPLEDIHLTSRHLNFNPSAAGSMNTVYMLSVIGIIILLIACVNYMNLATARSLTRAKEVGVRKVIGAYQSNLVMQFLSEAVVISFLGIAGAVALVALLLPTFSGLVERELTSQIFLQWEFWGASLIISLVVGAFAGSYPAFYMSKLKPILILKSQVKGGKGNAFFRNLLVVGQFTITAVLLIGSIVVFQQLQFMRTTDTGLNREQVLTVSNRDPELWDRFETVKTELLKNPGVEMVSSSQMNPIYMSSSTRGTEWEGQEENEELTIYVSPVGFDFTSILDLEVIAGRAFSPDLHKEMEKDYLINESAVRELGWTNEEALGKSFQVWGNDGTIVGVVKDFHFQSLDQPIAPLTIMLGPEFTHRHVLLKTNGQNIQETIAGVEHVIKEFSPGYPFSYSFLDERYMNMYNEHIRLGTLFNYFSILALFIACMGLFGLATFITEQRTKEIGIRKVLGADVIQILTLLNKDFLKLVGISFVVAVPLGWFLSRYWLEDFAYRIDLGPAIFLTAGVIVFGIALLTVSAKSLKTATANPVKSLRSE